MPIGRGGALGSKISSRAMGHVVERLVFDRARPRRGSAGSSAARRAAGTSFVERRASCRRASKPRAERVAHRASSRSRIASPSRATARAVALRACASASASRCSIISIKNVGLGLRLGVLARPSMPARRKQRLGARDGIAHEPPGLVDLDGLAERDPPLGRRRADVAVGCSARESSRWRFSSAREVEVEASARRRACRTDRSSCYSRVDRAGGLRSDA